MTNRIVMGLDPGLANYGWLLVDGYVCDVTWQKGDTYYFGVEFDSKYVVRRMVQTGRMGSLIDDYLSGLPLFKQKRLGDG